MKITYDNKLIQYMSLFENLTNSKVKDAYLKEKSITFVVEKGDAWKAIGKNGSKIKKIQDLVKKKIKIIEFDDRIEKFSENLIKPIEVENIEFINGNLEIKPKDSGTKGLLIGRESKNLREIEEILSRYFKLKSVKIL